MLRKLPARDVWFAILDAQIETGTPYMMYKDHCNRKSNQQNLGTIRGSNLCCEIVEYTSPDEVAVCTLASISLTACASPSGFDFEQLERVARLAARNLNKTIDGNYYPIEQARRSNFTHRPIGIGVQGFADALAVLELPYASPQARELNKQIFETIYYASMYESNKLAKKLQALEIKIKSKVGSGDKLFGSIGSQDVADAFEKSGETIEKKFITLPGKTIKRLGAYEAAVRLHRAVVVQVAFEIIAE